MAYQPSTFLPGRNLPPRFPIRFRHDLLVTSTQDKLSGKKTYLIEDPVSHESYNFGEEEYFLCQSMDGSYSTEEILSRFERYFGQSMTEEALRQVGDHICSIGLAENLADENDLDPPLPGIAGETNSGEVEEVRPVETRPYHWSVANPERFFAKLLKIVLPLKPIVKLLNWVLVPGVPIALYIFFAKSEAIHRDLAVIGGELSYLGGILFTLLVINLTRAILEGLVCTYHGVKVKHFGFRLHVGVIPRFYIDRTTVKHLGRSAQLSVYSTSPLWKLYLITYSVFTWFFFQGTGTNLAALACMLANVALAELVAITIPFFEGDGYKWLCTTFRIPLQTQDIALRVMGSYFTGKPVPTTISKKQRFWSVFYGVFAMLLWLAAFIKIGLSIAHGVEVTFPGIFGRITGPLIILIILYFVFSWGSSRFIKPFMSKEDRKEAKARGSWFGKKDSPADSSPEKSEKSKRSKYAIIIILCLLPLLPYPYRPGGTIEIYPPNQQQIQAPVSGKVEKVFFSGGDGKRIARGTVVAKMVFSEIDNAILVLQRQIEEKKAGVDKEKSELAKLLSGARLEELSKARAQLVEASEEVDVAAADVQAAKATSVHAVEELAGIQMLFEKGVFSRMQLQDAKVKSEIALIEIGKKQKSLAAKEGVKAQAQAQLDLLLAGARPEDIDAARRAVEAAEAEQRRLEQQLAYAQKQQSESDLLMPFDGYLIESSLERKVGSYIRVGEVFASAQDNDQQLVVVKLPEYEAGDVRPGAAVQIKLLAYSGDPLKGKVISIQPASTQKATATERIFQVWIEIQKPPMVLKPGMTGYGKIETGLQPLGLIMTRPLIRFFQVEVWSWLP